MTTTPSPIEPQHFPENITTSTTDETVDRLIREAVDLSKIQRTKNHPLRKHDGKVQQGAHPARTHRRSGTRLDPPAAIRGLLPEAPCFRAERREMMDTIVAEGVWCAECEYFEVEDFDGDNCLPCGCERSVHYDAEVVTK